MATSANTEIPIQSKVKLLSVKRKYTTPSIHRHYPARHYFFLILPSTMYILSHRTSSTNLNHSTKNDQNLNRRLDCHYHERHYFFHILTSTMCILSRRTSPTNLNHSVKNDQNLHRHLGRHYHARHYFFRILASTTTYSNLWI